MKKVIALAALAALVSSPALAHKTSKRAGVASITYPTTWRGSPLLGFGALGASSITTGNYISRDPDPAVQFQLLKELGASTAAR